MAESGAQSATASDSRGSGSFGLGGILAVVVGLAVVAGAFIVSREQELTIIVVSLDTTRPDHLSAYGHDRPTSPTLERLAREGTVFRNARSSTSWTLPSHMSLFTGLPPDLHRVVIDFNRLDAGRKTMGEVFKAADYRTLGLFSGPYVHKRFGFDRGMDFYESATQYPMAYDLTPEQMNLQMAQLEKISHMEVTSNQVTGRAMYLLERRRRPRNFVFLHYFDPHYDYYPTPKAREAILDPSYKGPINGQNVTVHPAIHAGMRPKDLDRLESLYDAEIRWVDMNLGEFVTFLEQQELVGKTIVVVTADHGEEFFEHGKFGHRMGLYDEVLRIPLMFWGPGIIPAGQVIEDDVALYDVLPTLMDYAGIDADEDIYGRSLRPLIDGSGLSPRPSTATLTFLHRPDDAGTAPDYYTRHDALVYAGLKYVRRQKIPWSRTDPLIFNNPPFAEEHEAFDLVADPGETENLFESAPDDPRLKELVEVFQREAKNQMDASNRLLHLGAPALELDSLAGQDIFRSINALGYLTGDPDPDPEAVEPAPPPPPAGTSDDEPK